MTPPEKNRSTTYHVQGEENGKRMETGDQTGKTFIGERGLRGRTCQE